MRKHRSNSILDRSQFSDGFLTNSLWFRINFFPIRTPNSSIALFHFRQFYLNAQQCDLGIPVFNSIFGIPCSYTCTSSVRQEAPLNISNRKVYQNHTLQRTQKKTTTKTHLYRRYTGSVSHELWFCITATSCSFMGWSVCIVCTVFYGTMQVDSETEWQ